MKAFASGNLSADRMESLFDAAVRDTIRRFEEAGSPVSSDGEQRKPSFATYPIQGAENFGPGGVTIPFDPGLAGHSDADAVCHAITDAVLGAAGAGDIGRHFPDTDPAWKGASSVELLRRAVEVVRDRGYEIGNVDASVIAERPKLLPYIEAMTANVAAALGISADRVSIKGKTNEGVGALGRGEAIAVHAIALVRSKS